MKIAEHKSLFRWKEPYAFTRRYLKPIDYLDPQRIKVTLFLTLFFLGLFLLPRLIVIFFLLVKPGFQQPPIPPPSLPATLFLAVLMGTLATYILPFLSRIAPSWIEIFPGYLRSCQGLVMTGYRFSRFARHQVKYETEGWILRLYDLDGNETAFATPNEKTAQRAGEILSASGVGTAELPPELIAARREADEKFSATVQTFLETTKQWNKRSGRWFIVFLVLNLVLAGALLGLHYPAACTATLVEMFVGMFVVIYFIGRPNRQLAQKLGLSCRHCGKLPLGQYSAVALQQGHSCPSCGQCFYELPVLTPSLV